jgi:hypothetical protein
VRGATESLLSRHEADHMDTVRRDPPSGAKPETEGSPMFLLAVLASARKSGDRMLERIARERLAALDVRVIFDAERGGN